MGRIMLALAGAIAAGSLASPAIAAPEPSSKLVRCGEQSCLQVTGHRDDPTSIVRINGHAVSVEGERKWKASVPLEVVREWSAPNARTIEVSLGDPEGQPATIASVDLPIGLLANATTLAALVINVH
jgi:hypothetical protein